MSDTVVKSGVQIPRIASAVAYDVLFQWRHGFYIVYAILCAIYIGALLPVPETIRSSILPILVFTDPSVIGYFFIGGIILLERDQGIFASLFVTPYPPGEYIVSKVISFLALSLVSSFAIALPLAWTSLRPGILALAVVLTSPLFTLIGVAVGSRMRVVNAYILISVVLMPPLFLPLLEMLGLLGGPVWQVVMWIIPTRASLILFRSAFGLTVPAGELIFSCGYLLLWTGAVAYAAWRWFLRYVVFRIGGGR